MDITIIVQLIIMLIFALVSAFVIPFLKKKLGAADYAMLAEFVSAAVRAAEQIFDSGTGEDKKQYVVEYLEGKNIKCDFDTIDKLIEAEVYKLNMEQKAMPAADEVSDE